MDSTEDLVVVGHYNGCISIISSDLSRVIATCSRHMGPVYDVRCHEQNNTLISGSSDCTLRVWDLGTGEAVHVFRGHETMISRVLPLGSRVFSLDIARVNVWCLENKKNLHTLKPITIGGKEGYFQPGLVHGSFLSGNHGTYDVIGVGSSSGVYIWKAADYTLLRVVTSPGYVCAEHVIGLGSLFIAVTYDDGVALIDTVTGSHTHTLRIPQFNNSNCGIWINRDMTWLSGGGGVRDRPVFVAASHSGDVAGFYIRSSAT